jgi:hypothetical protein
LIFLDNRKSTIEEFEPVLLITSKIHRGGKLLKIDIGVLYDITTDRPSNCILESLLLEDGLSSARLGAAASRLEEKVPEDVEGPDSASNDAKGSICDSFPVDKCD